MAWDVLYYRAPGGATPGLDVLLDTGWPTNVRATMLAVLTAAADAPAPRFSGGGLWEAMHGDMSGFYEVHKQGSPNRTQYRLFCVLENPDAAGLKKRGLPGPAIVVITGMSKRWMATFTAGEYATVRAMADEYRATFPRRIAE